MVNENERRSKTLRRPIFMNILIRGKFRSAYDKFLEGNAIYRGVKGSAAYPYWIVDPHKFYRKSRNTNNFYTGLIDRLPSWRNWPKRSRSIICSTNPRNVSAYGHSMIVFPKNGSKIGICSEDDFWYSFPVVKKRLAMTVMSDFNYCFHKTFIDIDVKLGKLAETLNETNYDEFMNELQKIKVYDIVNKWVFANKRGTILKDMNENFDGDWETYFDGLLNPQKNEMSLQTIETFNPEYLDREVWTDNLSLMVGSQYNTELRNSLSRIKIPPEPGEPNLDIEI